MDETCTNVIMRAYEKDSSENHTVICFYNTKCLSAEVQDRAKLFRFEAVPEPEVKARIEEQKVGNLGIGLIRQIMDEVKYYQEPDGWKRLVKKNIQSSSQVIYKTLVFCYTL